MTARTADKQAYKDDTEAPVFTKALEYARRGWHVLPLREASKVPLKGSHGVHDATTDAETIQQWWDANPHANLAIATGGTSGLCVLDVDPRHGGNDSLDRLLDEHGPLPDTVKAVTGGNGRHVYFAAAEPLKSRTLAPGVELKGDGCYVVAPPSVHPDTGAEYAWELSSHPDHVPLAPLPDWIARALLQRDTSHYVVSDVSVVSVTHTPESVVASTLPEEEGERNRRLLELARGLKHNAGIATVEDCEPHLREWHRLALPNIRTKSYADTELDFEHAFEHARYPLGVDLAVIARNSSKESDMPNCASRYESHVSRLIATCKKLQELQGDRAFSLSTSQAARELWGDCEEEDPGEWASRRTRANRWLKKLVSDGVLAVEEKSRPGRPGSKATTFRFIGNTNTTE